MTGVRRLILFNQVTGPLFRQLAEGLASRYPGGCLLVTAQSEALSRIDALHPKLMVHGAAALDRRSSLRRVLSWVRYSLGTTRYVLFAREGDAFLLVANPPLLGPWIWLLSHLRRIQYVVLVYDIHPDGVVRHRVLREHGWLVRIWRATNRKLYGRAQAVVTIGHRMAAVLQRQAGRNGSKVAVVAPWADVALIQPIPREQNPHANTYVPDGPVVVLYSGNMGKGHDIDSILEAALRLRDDSTIFFLLIGEGEKYPRAAAFAERHQLTNLRVFPFQPENRLPFTLPLGDIALVTLDEGFEDLMIPSKSFYHLAAGSALIAIANEPSELSDLLNHGKIGVLIGPRQPVALAEAIRALARDPKRLAAMRHAARRLAEKRYSREAGVDAFVRVLDRAGLGGTTKRENT